MPLDTNDFLNDLLRWKKMYIYEKKTLQRSKNTILQYERILEKFYEYSIEHEDYMKISMINKQYFLNFLMYLDENTNVSANSKHSYITVIKSFFKYISENNTEEINLLKKIKDIKISLPKRKPKGLTKDEIDLLNIHLTDLVENNNISFSKKKINFRNSLIIKILLYGGLRVSEVIGLKFSDVIYIEEHNVYKMNIIGKGDKEREIYISKDIIFKEINFLKEHFTYIAETNKGNLLDRKNIHKSIKSIYDKCSINKSGVHILRHTFAQSLVNKNINLSTIKDLLGHSNIQTTMIYASSNENVKINAIKQLS